MYHWEYKNMRIKFIKNNRAVSQVIGYVLTLQIVTGLMIGIVYMSNEQISKSNEEAAKVIAQDIANVVSEGVIGAVSTRRNMDNAAFEFELDVPETLAGKSYYVEIADEVVYVNSTDGSVSKSASTFKAEVFGFGFSGRAYGSNGKIKIFSEKNEDVCKFDFGNSTSKVESGYIRIHPGISTTPDDWLLDGWSSRLLLTVNNAIPGRGLEVDLGDIENKNQLRAQDLYDFQYLLNLEPSDIDYYKAREDGSDLRIYNHDAGNMLDYWIESWNPYGTSKVWIKLTDSIPLLANQKMNIAIYYGNKTNNNYIQNPSNVFNFYDDFNTRNNCSGPFEFSIEEDGDESYLKITQNNATILTAGKSEGSGPKGGSGVDGGSDNIFYFRQENPLDFGVKYSLYMVEAIMNLSVDSSSSGGGSVEPSSVDALLAVLLNLPEGLIITGGYPPDYQVQQQIVRKDISSIESGDSVTSTSGFVAGSEMFPVGTKNNEVLDVFEIESGGSLFYEITLAGGKGTFCVSGDQGVLAYFEETHGVPPFQFTVKKWRWTKVSDLEGSGKICIYNSSSKTFSEVYYSKTTTTSFNPYQISLDDNSDDGNYIVYPTAVSRYGILSKAINVAHVTLQDYFAESYITSSTNDSRNGYALYKGGSERFETCETTNVSIPNNWFLQRTGVFLGRTYNSSAVPPDKNQYNYTVIGNARFNCTWDKKPGAFNAVLRDVFDTNLSDSIYYDPGGPPFLEGNIGIAVNLISEEKTQKATLLVDNIRVWQSLLYDLNVTVVGQEYLSCDWDRPPQGLVDSNIKNDSLLYDANYNSSTHTFIVGNLPVNARLTVTMYMVSLRDGTYNTTVDIYNNSNTLIKTVNSDIGPGESSTLSVQVESKYADGTLKFRFSPNSNNWIINAIEIEKGFKTIQVGEKYV
jgi:hypothetical protein